MRRYVLLLFLSLMLVCVSMGCTPMLSGPTQPSGYFFSVIVSDPQIYLLVNRLFENLPDAAQIIVQIRNAQGQPIDGVPITFQVEPDWAQYASLTPSHAVTQDGEAHAVLWYVSKTRAKKPALLCHLLPIPHRGCRDRE
jgi:hypothetical protein